MDPRSEVVISGISGRYPSASNTEELWNILIEGQNVMAFDAETKQGK